MASDEPQPYRFDWQMASDEDFVKWLVPTLLVGTDKATMEQISELSAGWTRVELEVSINGVVVDARHFIESIERNLTSITTDAASELLYGQCSLHAITEMISDLERSLRREVERRARKLGVEIGVNEDERY